MAFGARSFSCKSIRAHTGNYVREALAEPVCIVSSNGLPNFPRLKINFTLVIYRFSFTKPIINFHGLKLTLPGSAFCLSRPGGCAWQQPAFGWPGQPWLEGFRWQPSLRTSVSGRRLAPGASSSPSRCLRHRKRAAVGPIIYRFASTNRIRSVPHQSCA